VHAIGDDVDEAPSPIHGTVIFAGRDIHRGEEVIAIDGSRIVPERSPDLDVHGGSVCYDDISGGRVGQRGVCATRWAWWSVMLGFAPQPDPQHDAHYALGARCTMKKPRQIGRSGGVCKPFAGCAEALRWMRKTRTIKHVDP
jgi:hypothetical protein